MLDDRDVTKERMMFFLELKWRFVVHTRSGVLRSWYFDGEDGFEVCFGERMIFSSDLTRKRSSRFVSFDRRERCGDGNDDFESNNKRCSNDWEFWLDDGW